MKRTDWKYLVDSLLFISFFGLALIGILMGFFIASGPKVAESDKYFLGLYRHQWGDIHIYLALTFVTLGIIHLILSWSWIKGKAKNIFKSGWKIMMTATVLAGLLVVVLFWAFSPKNSSVYEGYGLGRGRNLQAGESRISTPAQRIIEALSLPPGISLNETLGRLRKIYPFTIQQVREVVEKERGEGRSPKGHSFP
ncbi:MAG: DUF4405 domain-containing protein [Acidobacteriota bacterium]